MLRNNSLYSSLWTITLPAGVIVRDTTHAAKGYFGYDMIHTPAPQCAASRWHVTDAFGRCRMFPPPLPVPLHMHRYQLPDLLRVVTQPILGACIMHTDLQR